MAEFFRDWFAWFYLYLHHFFVMMYWVTIPGLLTCGFLSVRYRPVFRGRLLKGASALQAILYAVGLGMTAPASRREGLENASALMSIGAPAALSYLIASQTLGLYFLLAFTILIGLEFSLGVLVGGLIMAFLVAVSTKFIVFFPRTGMLSPQLDETEKELVASWRDLLVSARGWHAVINDIVRIFKVLWFPSFSGLVLGALILAVDMRKAWPLPFWLGDEGFGPAAASSFLGPLLSFISFSLPLGNLVVASSVWKTWTFAYPGIITFVLAASLHPLSLRSVAKWFDPPATKYVIATFYLSAALGSLTVIGIFRLLGIEVTHVPWFEPLVKKIIMMLPFTMSGTGGMSIFGKMGEI